VSGYSDGSRYEILYDLPKGEVDTKTLGGVRTKTIRAGDTLEIEVYPLVRVDAPAREEARKRGSSPAQIRLNLHNSMKRIRRLCEANFGTGDFVLHPTFDYGAVEYGFINKADQRREWERLGYPTDEDQARKIIRNFIARVRRYVKKCGGDPKELRYLYVVEKTKEPQDGDINALPAHYHYHMAISGCGCLSIAALNELWGYGHTKCEPVDMRYNGLKGFSTYVAKRVTRLKRKTRWACSKNMKQPEVTVSDRKISRRRLAQIARDVQYAGKEILEKLYPEYQLAEAPEVRFSDFVAGAYIYARMRRRD
jgi:hypothetical protein